MIECYSGRAPIPGHLDWPTLDANRARLNARRLMLTHMCEDEGAAEVRRILTQYGIDACYDGRIIEL